MALAAYAGSAIAKSNPMKTGVNATKLAIGAFIVPYIFGLNPAMLFIDTTPLMIVQICISSLVGMFGIAAAMNGYLFRHMGWPARLLILAGGLLMLLTPWPALLGGLLALPYILNLVPFLRITDAGSAAANAGWKRFLKLNFLTGFLVTLLIIWYWPTR